MEKGNLRSGKGLCTGQVEHLAGDTCGEHEQKTCLGNVLGEARKEAWF